MDTISQRVEWARTVAGLSRRRLSALAGLSPAALQVIETKRDTSPEAQTIIGIGRVLGVSTDWLLTGKGGLPTQRKIKRAANAAQAKAAA